MIVLDGDKATENKKVPWHHVALKDGYAPFDWVSWTTDLDGYRGRIRAAYDPNPPGTLGFGYEETAAAFLQRRPDVRKVYRAIRIRSQSKNLANELAEGAPVGIEPEGGWSGLFSDLTSVLDRMAAYQRLEAWPQDVPIFAANPYAHALPIQHVSGDNYATQYISTAIRSARARICSLTSYASGTKRIRRAYEWSPIIEIDLARLGDDCRIVDLSTEQRRRLAGFFPTDGRSHTVGSLAESDGEVLLTGRVPGTAVTGYANAVAVVTMEKDDLYQDARKHDSVVTWSKNDKWRHLAALLG
ncbi:hypothetical protein [Actinomadura parmotrematis]|uniref:Uncharacterized protein n=1 Tax=Actinomadura parmotrematis TaxID=2864039 RepID=A0ABS7FPB2_9ACTN|nr:hypothetical protein [Actinomadura parmotrematis]MBW8482222.1 hypothetical protein [Actinomadura parmotrematis]